jgi:hypothetical protein
MAATLSGTRAEDEDEEEPITFRYRRLSNTIGGRVGGDMMFGHSGQNFEVDTPTAVAQSVYTRLLLWQTEWYLDTNDGTPWYQQVLGKPIGGDPTSAIRNRILGTPYLKRLIDFAAYYDSGNRVFTVGAKIDTVFGVSSIKFQFADPPPMVQQGVQALTPRTPLAITSSH